MSRRKVKSLSVQEWAALGVRYRNGWSLSRLAKTFRLTVKQVEYFRIYWGFRRRGFGVRYKQLPLFGDLFK